MTRRALIAIAAACVLHAAMAAQIQDAQTRALRAVPAPVGEGGAPRELYRGSYALIVGVSRYDDPAWRPLASVPSELAGVAAALRNLGFDKVEEVYNPTGDELRAAVRKFAGEYRYGAQHRLVFFFSGHGYTLDDGRRGYFVPRDAPDPKTNEGRFRHVSLGMDDVLVWARNLTARHVLFAFDSCFSGTIFSSRSAPIPQRITTLTAQPVRAFLAAGDANQEVPAESVFTPLFIAGLKGDADIDRDGFITGTELGNFVQNGVLRQGTGQRPQFGKINDVALSGGDLVFAVPSGAAPPAAPPPGPENRSTPPGPAPTVPPSAADREAIVEVLTDFRRAYESMDVEALRTIFPKFGNFDSLRESFADLQSIAVAMNPGAAKITVNADGTALAVALYSVTSTMKNGRMETFPRRATNAHFRLRKTPRGWIIEQLDYK